MIERSRREVSTIKIIIQVMLIPVMAMLVISGGVIGFIYYCLAYGFVEVIDWAKNPYSLWSKE